MVREDTDQAAFDRDLGEALLADGLVDMGGIERARRVCETSGQRLHAVLIRLALVTERDMATALARQLGLPLLGASDYPDAPVLETISARFLKEARVVPIAESDAGLLVAMSDPLDDYVRRAVQLATGRRVCPHIGIPADIEAAIDRLYGAGRSAIGQIIEEIADGDEAGDDVERLKDLAAEAPVIRLVNALIARAVEARASDIHVEPLDGRLRVRYRIDGIMHEVEGPPARLRAAVISRIKILARLDIAERRLPQDGRIRIAVRGKEIDLRVSTLPSLHGESVVLRILDRGVVALDLPTLGFGGELLDRYLGMLERPNGIVLVTGPTGHGKTTTLYASLKRLNTPDTKIHTVEDPVEYQLDGIMQIQVKPQIGLSFAEVLRSILRQNPNIILIGEIRDLETAQIAMQASLTGHLVLSTLHTNSAAGSITRMLDMGVEDYLLTATLNGVCAQRLVRTLCPHCREPYEPLPELVERMGLDRFADGGPMLLHRPVGCAACHGVGFHGRTTIAEALLVSEPIRRLVLTRADVAEIARIAMAEGMRAMYEDGMRKALAGLTTPDEVLRATREG
ncbi:MAG TPA: ATPase, T2SS/T4P/T4SS family [Azospirillum sp.]|nr:ATPase, T2SS/T4P/T4SS family [Azospirillum sp.]